MDGQQNNAWSDFERRIAASAPPVESAVRDEWLFQAGVAQGLQAGRRAAWRGAALASAASIALCLAGAYVSRAILFESSSSRSAAFPASVAGDGSRALNAAGDETSREPEEGVLTPVGARGLASNAAAPFEVAPVFSRHETAATDDGVWRAGMSLSTWDF